MSALTRSSDSARAEFPDVSANSNRGMICPPSSEAKDALPSLTLAAAEKKQRNAAVLKGGEEGDARNC